jgi:hypothetical protein
MIKLKKLLKEASESELVDIHNPSKFWKDFGKLLNKDLTKRKLQATVMYKSGEWSRVEVPFFANTWSTSTRIVQPRSHSGGSEDNELISKTKITITSKADSKDQKVIRGEKIEFADGIMDISMIVELNHDSMNFSVKSSDLSWFNPFKKDVFKMDLGASYSAGNSSGELVDYIANEIAVAVKKRGKRIKKAEFKLA